MARHEATYQARIEATGEADELLSGYASLFCRVERTLYKEMRRSGEDNPFLFKNAYLQRFGVTARQFNAVAVQLQGRICGVAKLLPELIEAKKRAIARAKQALKKLKDPGKQHQTKRRLAAMETGLTSLKKRQASGDPQLCFGGKQLFHAQFHLAENGYQCHGAWLNDWRAKRSAQFLVLGSKDESAGCQGCQARANLDGSFDLRLRLPDALGGGHLGITGIRFKYGADILRSSLREGRTLTYRFLRDEKGWRVLASTPLPQIAAKTIRAAGAIGVDLNEDRIAMAETDRFGNLVGTRVIPLCLYGKSSEQAQALTGEAAKQVAAYARDAGKPLIHERLDFRAKKAQLEGESPRRARMLSSFAYGTALAMLDAAAYRAGVEVRTVNPAYTTAVGAFSYQKQRGLSVHQAAAYTIARRGGGLREPAPTAQEATLLAVNGDQVTFALPARNRARHVWSFWARVTKLREAVLAAHRRRPRGQPARLMFPAQGRRPRFTVRPRDAKRREHCSPCVMDDEIPW